jgi:hypothetical protein
VGGGGGDWQETGGVDLQGGNGRGGEGGGFGSATTSFSTMAARRGGELELTGGRWGGCPSMRREQRRATGVASGSGERRQWHRVGGGGRKGSKQIVEQLPAAQRHGRRQRRGGVAEWVWL